MSSFISFRPIFATLVVAFMASGCETRVAPYIYAPETTNRDDANFGRDREDRGELYVCYNKYKTTPDEVRKLAVEECARFGRQALLMEQTLEICPLVAPFAARYQCWSPDDEKEPASNGAQASETIRTQQVPGARNNATPGAAPTPSGLPK